MHLETAQLAAAADSREAIINDAPKLHEAFLPGDVTYQGDLILVCIAQLPTSAKRRDNRQLADGNTQGSRHILKRGDVYDAEKAEIAGLIQAATGKQIGHNYIGPVFVSPEEPTCDDLWHPDHGNHGFKPAGAVVAVVYARNLDNEEMEHRVVD